jgi:hypothetical protein
MMIDPADPVFPIGARVAEIEVELEVLHELDGDAVDLLGRARLIRAPVTALRQVRRQVRDELEELYAARAAGLRLTRRQVR